MNGIKQGSKSTKPIDIAKEGSLSWRQLQQENSNPYETSASLGLPSIGSYAPLPTWTYTYEGGEQSPLMSQTTRTGKQDYLGNSVWDPKEVSTDELERLSDIRAENQPWYVQLTNGIAKAGVLAATTALETAGLIYGVGQGIFANNNKSFLQNVWDNPITNALQKINELSEEYMPNYYTRDEQENPFGNIFTANFLGDKILKNLGFMVGAFYGGIPASTLIGKAGTAAVKSARAAANARMGGIASRFGELTAGYTDDVLGKVGQYSREISGLSEETAASIGAKYGDDVTGLYRKLAAEGLTEGEKGRRMLESLDKINDVAQTTRATTQTIGALGSAINEGAIEALNNSKDWADLAIQQENTRYQQELEEELGKIDAALGGSEVAESAKISKRMELAQKHENALVEIERGKASMGNADLLLNIPILLASNIYQLGKLYTRGFDSTRRQMGSLWNNHRLSGSLEKGTLKSDKTWKGGVATALLKSNTEGLEEYLQRAASDGAGQAVSDAIQRYIDAGASEDSKVNVDNYIAGFGKAIADNLGNPQAWEEYMIGAVSSLIGMPVFGSQTKNAYGFMKDNGIFGFAGGFYGNYQDYMNDRNKEENVAKYLNNRVKDPKFQALYKNLRVQDDYDKWLQDELAKGDKSKYKDLELEKFYSDLNAAASAGHLEEFKQLIGYNQDYTDKELEDIVKETSTTVSADSQRQQDENRKTYLEKALEDSEAKDEDALIEDYNKELAEINKRLEENNYQDKQEGPFIDRNGQMNVTDPDKMREILNRNRDELLQGIDDYLKIRNDIDIESDGRLDDDNIAVLTQMKGKILNYEKRSAEMADDLIENLHSELDNQKAWRDKITKDLNKAQENYNKAKEHLEAVKKGKHSKEWVEKVEKDVLLAEQKLSKAEAANNGVNNAITLLEMLTQEVDTSMSERAARAKGYGEGIGGRISARFNTKEKRAVNSEEAQNILSVPQNAIALIRIINSKTSNLDNSTKKRLTQNVVDLSSLANQKIAYNNKIREFLGDPSKINEAYQERKDAITQKEKDNMSEDLASRIKSARSMSELHDIIREARQVDREVTEAAIQKAKQSSDNTVKSFLEDYEQGFKLYNDFMLRAQKLDDAVRTGVMETASSAWDYVLNDNDGVKLYDKLLQSLSDAAEDLLKENNPETKKTAEGITEVLKDLNIAKKSVATNKEVKERKTESKDDKADDSDTKAVNALAEMRRRKQEEKAQSSKGPESSGDTKESLQKDVIQEVKNSKQKNGLYKIDSIDGLSKSLKDRIQKYNEDNPDNKFTIDFRELIQRFTDEDIQSDSSNLGADDLREGHLEYGDEDDESSRSEEMKHNLKVSFKSDHPTKYEIELDYKVPYDAKDDAQLKAVQELLETYKAYQFIDKNYLGYLARAIENGHPTVYFLRSTDDRINKSNKPITFLAVKWKSSEEKSSAAEKAIRRYGFNNRNDVDLSEEIKPVEINGELYQIVGVMTLNGEIASEVSKAFTSLQGALNQELNPQLEEAKTNGQPFVISKLTSKIDTINTGRLEKRNDEKDSEQKVSLYEFMTSQQGDSDRRTSTEWEYGMPVYFGTIVNDFLNSIEDDALRAIMQEPNSTWMHDNNGAVLMYVPKPDGRLYPIRVTRRTVANWLNSDEHMDGQHSAKELIEGVVSGNIKNEYLGNIINYLKIIFDAERSISDRMHAKTMLNRYFIFGQKSPIHFNEDSISLDFGDNSYDLSADNIESFVNDFFEILSTENIMFSLPSTSIEKINGRDVVTSGVFEIGLRGFYNFNANFTIYPIDQNGETVEIQSIPEEAAHFAENPNIRTQEVKFDLGDGLKIYTVQGDGTILYNGSPVSADAQNIITLALQADKLPDFKTEMLNRKYTDNNVRKYVSDGIEGFEKVHIIHASEDWVYDGRKGNHDQRLYKLSSEQGNKLLQEFESAVKKFTTKEDNMLAINKLKKSQKETPASDTQSSVEETSKSQRELKQPVSNSSSPGVWTFTGKELKEIDSKGGKLAKVIADNASSPVIKKLFPYIQNAEVSGTLEPDDAANKIKKVLSAKKEEKKDLLNSLINEFKGCNTK